MNIDIDVQEILAGLQSNDSKSNINHPLVKLLFIIFYLFGVIFLLFTRSNYSDETWERIWLIFFLVQVLRGLDWRKGELDKFFTRSCILLLIGFAPLIEGVEGLVDIKSSIPFIKLVASRISIPDIIIIAYGIGAMICIHKVFFMDVVWISQKLPRILSKSFEVMFITYFVFRRFASNTVNESVEAARFKARIAGKDNLIAQFRFFIRTLSKQMLTHFSEIADITEGVLVERGLIKERRKFETIKISLTKEDCVSLVGLAGAAWWLVTL